MGSRELKSNNVSERCAMPLFKSVDTQTARKLCLRSSELRRLNANMEPFVRLPDIESEACPADHPLQRRLRGLSQCMGWKQISGWENDRSPADKQ